MLDQIIGLLIVLFVLFFPLIRRLLIERKKKRQEEIRPVVIPPVQERPKPHPPVKPHTPVRVISQTPPAAPKKKRRVHPLFSPRPSAKTMVIYHEVLKRIDDER